MSSLIHISTLEGRMVEIMAQPTDESSMPNQASFVAF